MSKSIKNQSASTRTSLVRALIAGAMILGGCGEMESELPTEVGSLQQKLQPTGPGAEVWRANMGVKVLTPVKDSVAKKITYVFEATNHGDDDARSVILVAHFPAGVTVSSISSRAFDTCTPAMTTNAANSYIQCNRLAVAVGATSSLTVTVSNPTNGASQASAQVFNISPDPLVENNYAHANAP